MIRKRILNFALAYSYIAGYKETGVAEESGIIAKIGFKILQKKSTAVKFQDTLSMPGAISGTQLFDWDGEVITGYEVIQPDVLSLGDEPYETPGTDIPISDNPAATPSSTPSVTPSPEVKPTQTPSPAENSAKVELEPVLDNATGEAKAAIDEEKLNKALDEAKKSEDDKLVELNIKKLKMPMLTYNSFRRNS